MGGGISFDGGGGIQKNHGHPSMPPTMGNPVRLVKWNDYAMIQVFVLHENMFAK